MSKIRARNHSRLNNRSRIGLPADQTSNLDFVDKKILKLVVNNSRLSYRELARHLGISVGTVIEHLNKLESEKIIEGYSALINTTKIGFPLTAIIEIYGKGGTQFIKYLSGSPNVCSVYSVTGRADAIVVAKFRDIYEISRFIRDVQKKKGVARTETLLVLDIHKEDFRPNLD